VQQVQIDNKSGIEDYPASSRIEINSQLKPLAEQITERMSSVEQFQQKLTN
jgi:hypothetical protein